MMVAPTVGGSGRWRFVIKMMKFAFKMMNFVLNMTNLIQKLQLDQPSIQGAIEKVIKT